MSRDIVYYPYKLYAEFEDGHQMYAHGSTETSAMKKLIDVQNSGKHGKLKLYTRVNADDIVLSRR